jgi:hypothetical protein
VAGRNRKLLGYGALAAGLLIVGTVAVLAYQSMQVPFQAPTVNSPVPAVGGCTPAPCANLQGYALWVTNLDVKGDFVTMRVTLRNSSDSTHAAPEDLTLVDSRGGTSPPVFDDSACTKWSRHEFNHGATYGPLTVCFRINSIAPPLVLHWTPDFGFVCCATDIKLS